MSLRENVSAFIKKQLEKKTNMSETEWLFQAAQKSDQQEAATHILKFTHPNARGSNIFVKSLNLNKSPLITTMSVGNLTSDFTGNAAALGVVSLLQVSDGEGKTLFDYLQSGEEAVMLPFFANQDELKNWTKDMLRVVRPTNDRHRSHTLCKQIYFPIEDNNHNYHLLSPLFPSSLGQEIYQNIEKRMFGAEAKEAREQFRSREDFPNLAVQKYGGSKAQNISYFNSKRRGGMFLLPSSPPVWKSRRLPPKRDIFFGEFGKQELVRYHLDELKVFILSLSEEQNNWHIRAKSQRHVDEIVGGLVTFGVFAREDEISWPEQWSADPSCHLPTYQKLWLNLRRANSDELFAAQRKAGEWQDELAENFARWLSYELRLAEIPVSDVEFEEWTKLAAKELRFCEGE